jgi:Zn-dependent peptidase ImmA (M78 family)
MEQESNPPTMTSQQMQEYERIAMTIRESVGVDNYSPFDPFALADQLNAVIKYDDEFDPKDWSGGAKVLPNGKAFLYLNSKSTKERMNATIVHELIHIIRKHQPASIGSDGLNNYDRTQEQEATQVAGAVLLPMRIVARAVWRSENIIQLANKYGASVELFEMRVKTLGLWKQYQEKANEVTVK